MNKSGLIEALSRKNLTEKKAIDVVNRLQSLPQG